jgi:hypothetical protein
MVWASDHLVHGPLEFASLVDWVKEGRVFPKTWVLAQAQNRWCRADSIEPLRPFFRDEPVASPLSSEAKPSPGAVADELRRFSGFAALNNHQLDQFVHFGELVDAPAGRVILKRMDPGDALFFLLSGELRVRVMVGPEDKTLGRVRAGECFGEIAMFMRTPRTADVVVVTEARMLRFTSEAFLLLINQLPQIAAPVLFGMAQVMAARVSSGNQQYQRTAASQFLWR